MATILFAAAGAALGAGFGGTVLGLSGAVIGRAIGATIGRAVDQRIMGIGSDAVEVGKLDRFHVMGASEGTPIAKVWGRMRLPGQVIWASPFRETKHSSGGKGMPSPKTVHYSYSVSLAIAVCEGEILGIGRIWADGDEISPRSLNIRIYNGTEDQLPDPLIEAHVGNSFAPAYRGIAYVVIEELELSAYGNRVPQFSFEVMRRAQGAEAEKVPDLQDAIRAVSLIPGTGEYALATRKLWEERAFGFFRTLNVNAPSGDTDLTTSLQQLNQELPNCKAVSLVVSWFGNDLRCGFCDIQPKVEQKFVDATQIPWRSGGVVRSEAQEVPRVDGRSIYGGTPTDASVIEAIRALQDLGKSVMFYPFILMDQTAGNTLADPYSENETQPPLPWRGRITLSSAPGRPFSPDQTDIAVSEVAVFFGSASLDDFSIQNGNVLYSGEARWGYRRFILHYAYLCRLAGGVESFCIGSEMRGLTQIRGEDHRFPAVEAFVQLAQDVRVILGPEVKISYAADWSEYFGFNDGNSFYFHLDPLWASNAIDFVGIDNYMPISDWRNEPEHADTKWKSIYNLEYLKANIAGGEGFDWYYSSPEDAQAQNRTPIQDSKYGEDWIFRIKDLKAWWSRPHHNRIDGIRMDHATDWVPQSKPIRFTEYGCAAIDKGTNEPNKFLDNKSSESSVPRGSLGTRDDFIQMQYFRAFHQFWNDPVNNPASLSFDGSMLDVDHCYAWAWDARPYPDFPRNVDTWADGENYYRGHWLNGRASYAPLDRVVREVCEDSGVQDIGSNDLFGSVLGYCTSNIQSGRSKIQPLAITYGFDCIESEGVVRFQTRGICKAIDISENDIVLLPEQSEGLKRHRSADVELVSRVRLSYVEADGNFSVAVAESTDLENSSLSAIETEYPLVLSAGFAKSATNRWLMETVLSREHISFDLPPSALSITAGTTLQLNGDVYRVDRYELNESIALTAIRIEPSIYGMCEDLPNSREWVSYKEPGPISRLWLDLPVIESDGYPHSPYLAIASDPWRGPAILWSSNADSNYSINTKFQSPSSIGRTLSDLPLSGTGKLDRGSSLFISMPEGSLESTSLSGLLSGENMMAIGSGDPDNWEILQYMNVELHSTGIYSVSGRLRGLAGTDASMPLVWPSGSFVVLLDDSLKKIVLSSDHLNIERNYRLGFSSESIGSDAMQHDVISFRGNGLRPFSVVHLSISVDDQNGHCFRWVRRTRMGGDAWDGYDVPLNEERELYRFVVKSTDGTTILSRMLDQASFCFTLEERAQNDVISRYSAEVSQVSFVYGAGPGRRLDVDLPF